jgi:hypothetical protein
VRGESEADCTNLLMQKIQPFKKLRSVLGHQSLGPRAITLAHIGQRPPLHVFDHDEQVLLQSKSTTMPSRTAKSTRTKSALQTFVLMLSMYRVIRLLFSRFNSAISPIMPAEHDKLTIIAESNMWTLLKMKKNAYCPAARH